MKLPIERVPCKCGDLEGVLILRKALIEIEDANGHVKRIAPPEFESMGGRGSAKKWKDSVKVGEDIPQFTGKGIGAYMRDQLGVDINRGALGFYKPDKKPAAKPKATPAQPKQAVPTPKPPKSPPPVKVPKSPPPRKRASPVSIELSSEPSPSPPPEEDTSQRLQRNASEVPLLDRIQSHSERHFCCYEAPCEVYEQFEQEAPQDSVASILMKSPSSTGQPAAKRVEVAIHEGRPRSTKGVLCLETVSLTSLIELGIMSASKDADLQNVLLSDIPDVPADRLSTIPVYDRNTKKRSRAR